MKNYLTGYEYSGANVDILMASGFDEDDQFVTFKQALKIPGVSGKKLKGIKKAASLVRYREVEDDETGSTKKVPTYYAVFDVAEVMRRIH